MAGLQDSIASFSAELRAFAAQTTEGISNLRRNFNSKPCIGREFRLPLSHMQVHAMYLQAFRSPLQAAQFVGLLLQDQSPRNPAFCRT